MHFFDENNRLGITFVISILIHLTFLALLGLFTDTSFMPEIPEVRKIMVELFELPQEGTDEEPEEMKRFAEKSRKVKRETLPKSAPKPRKMEPPVEKKAEPIPSPSKAPSEKKAEKSDQMELAVVRDMPPMESEPTLDTLMPSIDRLLAPEMEQDLPDNVDEGKEVSLNTTEFRYASYFAKLKNKIQMVWRYPQAARIAGLQGQLTLRFVLNGDGTLKEVQVVKSSGFPILDEEAVKAVKRAAPYYAIPKSIGKSIKIVANFEYALDYRYIGR